MKNIKIIGFVLFIVGFMVSCDKHNDFQDLNFTPEELAEQDRLKALLK